MQVMDLSFPSDGPYHLLSVLIRQEDKLCGGNINITDESFDHAPLTLSSDSTSDKAGS